MLAYFGYPAAHEDDAERAIRASLAIIDSISKPRSNVPLTLQARIGIASGVVVDTHVSRLSQRLGLTKEAQPEKIEADLMKLLPRKDWINFSHRLILHGRRICSARKPLCQDCVVERLCPSSLLKAAKKN